MEFHTDLSLHSQVIYSVYVRNHTQEGTFAALEGDLDRIRAFGTDIIWLMPIHPIGIKGKKGSLGCPYANRDYRTVNPCYGTMEEFKHLVDEIHRRGMKCMIDVVYNHTSPDSVLSIEHPEWFYHDENGNFGNKIGDWADVIDLDYSQKGLWDYQIQSLKLWAGIVDGFRCDVASFVPLDFWKRARKEVEEVRKDCIWLAETVHLNFGNYARAKGFYAARDVELYEAFDMEYEYDIREVFERYLTGGCPLSSYADMLNFQEAAYPAGYNKLRYLENHDTKRFAEYVSGEAGIVNYAAMLYFLKGTTLLYAGQEYVDTHTPSLFEKEPFDRATGKDISGLFARLAEVKREQLDADDHFKAAADDEKDILTAVRENKESVKVGVFSLAGAAGEVPVELPDGPYENLIDGQGVVVFGGRVQCKGSPMILKSVNKNCK